MNIEDILSKVDHTFLSQTATENEIKQLIDEGIKYKTASVCIPPCYVTSAKNYSQNKIKICTVIGFPNGYQTEETKVFETENAIINGANEIDMVINIGFLKSGNYSKVLKEIKSVKKATGNKILKVIVESCLLTEEEKINICKIVTESGANFIKTSTGFSSGGATFDDISLFKKYIGENVKIKAAGGIKTLEDAEKFISLGADRLGTSKIVKIAKNLLL